MSISFNIRTSLSVGANLNTLVSCTLRVSDIDCQPFFQVDPEETWCSAKDVKGGGKLDLCGCS